MLGHIHMFVSQQTKNIIHGTFKIERHTSVSLWVIASNAYKNYICVVQRYGKWISIILLELYVHDIIK